MWNAIRKTLLAGLLVLVPISLTAYILSYLLFVPKKDIVDLDIPVEDALKLVISGGPIHLKDQIRSGKANSQNSDSKGTEQVAHSENNLRL